MKTVVLQSYRTEGVPAWIVRCIESVRDWAARQGYAHQFIGDSLFERVPGHLRARTDIPRLALTDLARLGLLREQLASGYDRVVWMDADILVFQPEAFRLPACDGALLCHEVWTELDAAGRLVAQNKLNNAMMLFERGHPLLDFLAYTGRRMLELTRPEHLHPVMLGPRLLTGLAQQLPIDANTQIANLSPVLLRALARGDAPQLLAEFMRMHGFPVHAAHLCGSLADSTDQRMTGANRVALSEDDLLTVVTRLLSTRGSDLPAPGQPA